MAGKTDSIHAELIASAIVSDSRRCWNTPEELPERYWGFPIRRRVQIPPDSNTGGNLAQVPYSRDVKIVLILVCVSGRNRFINGRVRLWEWMNRRVLLPFRQCMACKGCVYRARILPDRCRRIPNKNHCWLPSFVAGTGAGTAGPKCSESGRGPME